MPAFSVLTSPSFPGKQDQRGRGTGPRSHRSLDPSCRRPPTHPAWPKRPRIPRQGGSSAHVAQGPGGNPTSPLPPITQSEGGAVRTQGSAPLHQCPARPQPLVLRHPPQEFNPLPAEGRARDPHSRPAGTRRRRSGRRGEGQDPSSPSIPSQRAVRSEGQSGQVGG